MKINAHTPSSAPTPTTVPASGRTASTAHVRCTEIVFPMKVPGNNGKGGLLRMHWMAKTKLLNSYQWRVAVGAGFKKHRGPVRLELIRYSTGRPMDYDNLVSTGKLLIDAIVKAGVLPDDNPAIIVERSYTQERAPSKAAQRTVIRLTDLPLSNTQPA